MRLTLSLSLSHSHSHTHTLTLSHLTMWGMDPQVDGDTGDSLVLASQSVCLHLYLPSHLVEVCELLSLCMEKLRPL